MVVDPNCNFMPLCQESSVASFLKVPLYISLKICLMGEFSIGKFKNFCKHPCRKVLFKDSPTWPHIFQLTKVFSTFHMDILFSFCSPEIEDILNEVESTGVQLVRHQCGNSRRVKPLPSQNPSS